MSGPIELVLDYETAFSSKYSLKEMSTAEYIMDNRFHAWGVGFKLVVNGKLNDAAWVDHDDLPRLFSSIDKRYGWNKVIMIAHNCAFDGAILAYRYGFYPGRYVCTQGLSNAYLMEWSQVQQLPGWIDYREQTTFPIKLKPGVNLDYICYMLGFEAGHKGGSLDMLKGFIPAEGKWPTDKLLKVLADDCVTDVESIYNLYKLLCSGASKEVHLTNHWCVKQAADPILKLDELLLEAEQIRLEHNKQQSINHARQGLINIGAITEDSSDSEILRAIRSSKQFPKILAMAGMRDIPSNFSKTNPNFLAMQVHNDPFICTLAKLKLQLNSSIQESRTDSYLNTARVMSGNVWPVGLMLSGARNSHRFGGTQAGGGNPQNKPKKGLIRKAVCAPDDHVIVVGDLTGIELRICMELCGEHELLNIIYNGGDPYVDFAVKDLYKNKYPSPKEQWSKKNVDAGHRFNAKTGVLQLQYQSGPRKLYESMIELATELAGEYTIPATEEECVIIHSAYKGRFKGVKKTWKTLQEKIGLLSIGRKSNFGPVTMEDYGITLPSGLRIRYCDLRGRPGKYGEQYSYIDPFKGTQSYWSASNQKFLRQNLYGGKVLENVCQSLTSEVMRPILLRINRKHRVACQVHDELWIMAKKKELQSVLDYCRDEFTRPVSWMPSLKLDCELDFAYRYGDAK